MPVIHCPHCAASVEIHPDDIGYKVLCPSCASAFQAGDAARPTPEPTPAPVPAPAPEPTPAPKDSGERTVRCVACRGRVQVGVEDLGHRVECPICGEQFRAEDDRPSRSRPPRDRDDDDDDEDYHDDGYGYGRGRRRRYREEDKEYILRRGREAIAVPANGLMWTGITAAVLCVLIGGGLTIAGLYQLDEPDPYRRQNYIPLFIYGFLIGIFGTVFHVLVAVSGYQAKKLKGKAWGYVGGGLGIASIVLTGWCNPTTWACMTFGIWMLVALSKREVQDAIDINTGREL